MILSILRHGHSPGMAEARVASDAERPLSLQGQADIRRAVYELSRRLGPPQLILHSTLARATQSAVEAADVLHLKGAGLEPFPGLANILPASKLYPLLMARAGALDHILIIGHQPQLGELASGLCSQTLALPMAGLITLQTQDLGPAKVLWVHSP